MEFIADFHVHSKYSRATSKDMDLDGLSNWAKIKGVNLLGTGDFTHPMWFEEISKKLEKKTLGIYVYNGVNFILTTEVCNIFYVGAKAKKIHNIIFVSTLEAAKDISNQISSFGDITSDGRPILNLQPSRLVKTVLMIDKDALIVPAHIWTPHFSLFGANAGFDNIEECFEDETKNIFCLETGLSSDPLMNWRWSKLDRFSLISNSDSHSPSKIGREANVFDCSINYNEIINTLKKKDTTRLKYTIEFFPEEGKYHWDGHRPCNVRLSPQEARQNNFRCPICGSKVTVGVMDRVEKLSDRKEGFILESAPTFKHMIPLEQIIADAKGVGVDSNAVQTEYQSMIKRLGKEFDILFRLTKDQLQKELPIKIATGILRVREGNVKILPGYDGVYGEVHIFDKNEDIGEKQLTFF